MPFVIAAIACSRTPKWTLPPAKGSSPSPMKPVPATVVLFEPARSAEPPSRSPGASAAIRPSAVPECLRVASALPSRPSTSFATKSAGTARERAASQPCAASACAPRQLASFASSAARSARFAAPRSAQYARTASGTRKVGDSGMPSFCLVAFTTSGPNGPPCTLDWPAHGLP